MSDSDRQRLLAGLEDCRWQQMRVLADFEEEHGNAVLAMGWRWLAANKRWPTIYGDDAYFSPLSDWGREEDAPECEGHLPESVVGLVRGDRPPEVVGGRAQARRGDDLPVE